MNDKVLVLRRTFPGVSAADVYDAWTRPELVARWYGPEGFANEIHEMELSEGGNYRLTMQAPDGSRYPLRGVFRTLQPPTRLVFTWMWETPPENADPRQTLVSIDISQEGPDVRLTLTHEGFPDESSVANHEMGWTGALGKLERMLAG
jgi:uncharacterized protein YndB with AHSA1/START domain